MASKLFQQAFRIAQDYDVSTPKDGIVLYSISYLPTKENRDKAFAYVKSHPGSMMIEHTDCGAKLVELGLSSGDCGLSNEEIADIWSIASKRFISEAKGSVTAFVNNADPRSVFCRMELPNILTNPKLTSINGIEKHEITVRYRCEVFDIFKCVIQFSPDCPFLP